MKPRCYNKPPYLGYWARVGVRNNRAGKLCVVYRWLSHRMSQGCKSYAVPAGTVPVPVMEKWDCVGCIHLPMEIRNAQEN